MGRIETVCESAAEQAERNRVAAEEIRRIDADRKAQQVVEMFEAMGVKVIDATPAEPGIPVTEQKQEVADVSLINEGKTMKLGDISAKLGFTVTAEFLASLGYRPEATEKNAKLYLESSFRGICSALVSHISNVAVGYKKAA